MDESRKHHANCKKLDIKGNVWFYLSETSRIGKSIEVRELPRWLRGKETACNAGNSGDMGSIPGSGRSLGGGHGNPLQYSCLENPWSEEHGKLQSIGSQKLKHDQSDWAHVHIETSRLMVIRVWGRKSKWKVTAYGVSFGGHANVLEFDNWWCLHNLVSILKTTELHIFKKVNFMIYKLHLFSIVLKRERLIESTGCCITSL